MPQTPVLGAPHCPFLAGGGGHTEFAPLRLAGWVAGGTVGSHCTLWAELEPVLSAYSRRLLLYALLRSWDPPPLLEKLLQRGQRVGLELVLSPPSGATGAAGQGCHLGQRVWADTVVLAADVSTLEDAG